MPRPHQKFTPLGISLDLPPYALPKDQWSAGQNVHFGDGITARSRGHKEVYPGVLHPPRWILNVLTEAEFYWLYAGDTGAGVTDGGGVHTDITGPAFDTTGLLSPFTGGLIEGLPVLNTQVAEPMFWNASIASNLETLPDWPVGDTCGAMRPFREFLIAMNMFSSGVRLESLVRWSDAAPPGDVPQSWTPAVDTLAGEFSLGYLPGRIVDGLTLRQSFILYKRHSTWQMDLVGGQFVFAQRPIFASLGVLAPNCVVEFRGQHFVFGDGDIVVHDGTTATTIADQRTRRSIFEGLDEDNFGNAWVAHDKVAGEIWVGVPESGAEFPSRAFIWSIEENQWGVRDLPTIAHATEGIVQTLLSEPTWDSSTQSWGSAIGRWNEQGISPKADTLVMAEPGDGGVLLLGPALLAVEGDTIEGLPFASQVERTGLDFGAPDQLKFVSRIFPQIQGPQGQVIFIRAGSQLTAESPIAFGPERPYVIGSADHVDVSVQGRFLAFGFRSEAIGRWRLTSYTVEVELRGSF